MESRDVAKLTAGALLVGASLLSGNAALITAAAGVGVNWASESLGAIWSAGASPAQAGRSLGRAYERALRRAVAELRKQYQAQYGKQTDLRAFELVSDCAGAVAQAEYPHGILSASTAQQQLVRGLGELLHGHDQRQVGWIKGRLLEQTALAFQQELTSDDLAWRMFHGWLLQQIAHANSSLGQSLRELPRVLAELRNPDVVLGAIDDATVRLETMLADMRAELRRIAAGGAPGRSVAQTHTQTISGKAQVGTAIAGNAYEPITVTQGPQILGEIRAKRDVNIATNQTINNAAPSAAPASDPASATATQPPELRLLLEDTDGVLLSALNVGEEAILRVALAEGVDAPDLDLQLEADGIGVEWLDGTRRPLKIRSGAAVRAPQWTLQPEQAGLLTLRVLVLANRTFVQQLALTVTCHDRAGAAVLSSTATAAATPQQTATVGFVLASVPNLPAHANALFLVFDREREGFTLRLLDGGSVTACPLALTDMGLADLLVHARTELLAIVHRHDGQRYVFQQPDPIIATLYAEQALAALARLGASLWQALFAGTGSGGDALALGERLRARSQATPLHLTIAAAHLPFPWPLLYDRDPSQPIAPDGFWGFRHVLASLPTSGRSGPKAGDLSLGAAQGLRALIGLNLTIDQRRDVIANPVIPGQRQAIAELGLVASELTTEPTLRDALAAGSDAALIYLYCHVLSVAPGGQPIRPNQSGSSPGVASTRIVMTNSASGLALRDLQLAAPLSRAPLLRGGPLVVLNACASAELSPLTYEGLAPYLLDLGARAVIGTECETPIYFGAAFGPALLGAVVRDRLSVGEALRATRRQFLEQHQNPLGLLYALYGSADLRVDDSNIA